MDQQPLISEDEPSSRFHHVASSICDGSRSQVIVWGGETSEFYSNDGRIQLATVVEHLDVYSEEWSQRDTRGMPHLGLSYPACTSFGNRLFMYGGCYDGTIATSSLSGVLSCLDLTTLNWSQLCPAGTARGPMRKFGCGIVQFHRDMLAVVGGYGIPAGLIQPGSTFIRDTSRFTGSGYSNEIHFFNLIQGSYSQVLLLIM